MIVDDVLVVEVKSTAELHAGANRQVYNYLRATNLEVGLLPTSARSRKSIAHITASTDGSAESASALESDHPFVRDAGPTCRTSMPAHGASPPNGTAAR
jgi:hypothetical protein